MNQTEPKKKSLEETLADALKTTRGLELKSERADAVRLAVQALLLMRGAINPQLFRGAKKFNPYPVLVKYIRASNAETLGGLADEVLRAISPNFITLRSLGELAEAIYRPETKLDTEALQLLQEETTPLVMLMKKIYQDARGFDEAESDDVSEGEAPNDTN
jgi:hypothetical protein